MFGAMKRHEIQVRRKAGQSHAEIARAAQVSTRTSKRVAKEAEVGSEDGAQRRRPGRPSKVAEHRPFVIELLAKEPELPTLEVLHRSRQAGYSGARRRVRASRHARCQHEDRRGLGSLPTHSRYAKGRVAPPRRTFGERGAIRDGGRAAESAHLLPAEFALQSRDSRALSALP